MTFRTVQLLDLVLTTRQMQLMTSRQSRGRLDGPTVPGGSKRAHGITERQGEGFHKTLASSKTPSWANERKAVQRPTILILAANLDYHRTRVYILRYIPSMYTDRLSHPPAKVSFIDRSEALMTCWILDLAPVLELIGVGRSSCGRCEAVRPVRQGRLRLYPRPSSCLLK